MKILLLNPPSSDQKFYIREGRCTQEKGMWATLWPPISLAACGAVLEKNQHDVEIVDCAAQEISRAAFLKKIRSNKYQLVAWSSSTPTINSDLAFADELKSHDPGIKTAVFGTHVSVLAEDCLNHTPGLDFVVRNEPEESMAELADALEHHVALDDIWGISYKDSNGRIFHNRQRPFIQDLDQLPFPAWHLLELEKYKLPLNGKAYLILAPLRGCPFPCTFCTAQTYYGRKLRRKSTSVMMKEIERNIASFGVKEFFIWADTFTVDRDYVMEFCQSVRQQGLDIGWTCNSRVDTVDQELLTAMREAGCWMISYGIESGNQKILDAVKKKITLEQSKTAVTMAKRAGIKVAAHFILGLPGETEKSIEETIDFALNLDPDLAQFYCATPFAGSDLYEAAKGNGWIKASEFREFSQKSAGMSLPGLAPERVNEFRNKAYRRFYFRPVAIFRLLKMAKAKGLFSAIAGGLKFTFNTGYKQIQREKDEQ